MAIPIIAEALVCSSCGTQLETTIEEIIAIMNKLMFELYSYDVHANACTFVLWLVTQNLEALNAVQKAIPTLIKLIRL